MFNTLQVYDELSKTMDKQSARMLVNVMSSMYEELRNSVTKEEFSDLKGIVKELAEAQKRTDERLTTLTERVDDLAEAQKRTEARVEELAEAQKRTEKSILQLSKRLDQTNKQLGGLNMTVGYTLENEAYRYLPNLLRHDWQIEVLEPLRRDWLSNKKGRMVEVNIVGQAQREGEKILLVGESKLQLSRKYVDNFLKNRVQQLETNDMTAFPVIVSHMESEPGVVQYAKELGVAVYLSYQFNR